MGEINLARRAREIKEETNNDKLANGEMKTV